ncbi:MAG: ABC transporter permease subunit [Gemmatimonadota bacterium]
MNLLNRDTVKITRYQLRDILRSRWILLYGGFFLLLTDLLFRFGGSGERVILSLLNVILIGIPLVGIVLGAMYFYASREFTELLLAHPVRRRSLFMGLFLGLTLPMSLAFVLGTGLPYWAHGGGLGGGWGPLFSLLGTGVLLTLVFVALAYLVAVRTEDRIKGLGLCLGAWIAFAVVYDGLILMAIYLLGDFPLERVVLTLSLLNPVDLARILLLLEFDVSALMGFTGAVFRDFFGGDVGKLTAVSALLAWLALPFALGIRSFRKKNF